MIDPLRSASVVLGHFVGAWLRSVLGQVKSRVRTPCSRQPDLGRILSGQEKQMIRYDKAL